MTWEDSNNYYNNENNFHKLHKGDPCRDGVILNDLKLMWFPHFEMMQEIVSIKFQRHVVPKMQ